MYSGQDRRDWEEGYDDGWMDAEFTDDSLADYDYYDGCSHYAYDPYCEGYEDGWYDYWDERMYYMEAIYGDYYS